MMRIFNVFLIILFLDLLTGPIFNLLGQSGHVIFFQMFKLITLCMFGITVIYVLTKRKIFFTKESITFVFIILIPIPFIIGMPIHKINSATFSHIYAIIMPIFAISFGYYFGKDYINTVQFKKHLSKIMNIVFFANSLTTVAYQISFQLGLILYPATGPIGLFFTSVYYLKERKWIYYFISIIMIIISGKRLLLVITLVSSFYYFYTNSKFNFKKVVQNLIFLFLIIGTFMYFYNETSYLNRFDLTINNFDLSDEHAMFLATGGRSEEMINIINYLNESPWRWFLGSGIGVSVEVHQDYFRHYSHFTPLGYTMVFGIIFSILLYTFLLSKIFKKEKDENKKLFRLLYIGLFFGSFFGANLFADPKFWVILGIISCFNKSEADIRSNIKIN